MELFEQIELSGVEGSILDVSHEVEVSDTCVHQTNRDRQGRRLTDAAWYVDRASFPSVPKNLRTIT